MVKKIISVSVSETQKVAKDLVKKLKHGGIVALYGELGSGKTTFVQGSAKSLKIKEKVQSPTFVIVKEYKIDVSSIKYKVLRLIHIDLYRVKSVQEAKDIGITEYFNQPGTITFIEWPEKIEKLLPKKTIKIEFEHVDENKRKIVIKY